MKTKEVEELLKKIKNKLSPEEKEERILEEKRHKERKIWNEILVEAENSPCLQAEIERVKVLYFLSKK